jgi:hypothetical protein
MAQKLRILITVKTYPIPSAKYDELVCTAGVTESGDFVRLYPVNFRDLPYSSQYQKYQWMDVEVARHTGRDSRKESYRPNSDTIRLVGEPIQTKDNWAARAKYALAKKSQSMEQLFEKQAEDKTSLGVFRPKVVRDLVITPDDPEWKPGFLNALRQQRLWETRKASKEPPRKVPYKFHYRFECDDTRCNKNHQMMIEDWELGALYWKCVDGGDSPDDACRKVKQKFLEEICGPKRDTYFYVGTILAHPKSWVVIGTFWPKVAQSGNRASLPLFDQT